MVAAARLAGVGKRYGGVQALDGIDLELAPGRVHALVGENGAGKSTCLGTIAGRVVPDAGEVSIFGAPSPLGRPRELRARGVAAIYQELTIVPHLSTQANVFLGYERASGGVLREAEMAQRLRALCRELGVDVPVGVPAGRLSVAGQQLVEIMRALVIEPRLILFDEPTASLAPHEREVLYAIVRRLREDGVAVAFVSHNLEEVLALSDDVTVFRNGRVAERGTVDEWTKQRLIDVMVGGRRLPAAAGAPSAADVFADANPFAPPALTVRGLDVGTKVAGVDLEVRAGEIVGIAGLVGSGRSTCLRAIAGTAAGARGELRLGGERLPWPQSPRVAQRAGIFLVPEDRRGAGLVMPRDGVENILLSSLGRVAQRGFMGRRTGRAEAVAAAEAVGFDPRRLGEPVANLSGGNQQKIVLARCVCRRPRVLLADEPTRGVDVGAKAEIAASLRRLARDGMGVLVVSSELEELEELCERVYVISGGRIAGELHGADVTVPRMVRLAFERADDLRLEAA